LVLSKEQAYFAGKVNFDVFFRKFSSIIRKYRDIFNIFLIMLLGIVRDAERISLARLRMLADRLKNFEVAELELLAPSYRI